MVDVLFAEPANGPHAILLSQVLDGKRQVFELFSGGLIFLGLKLFNYIGFLLLDFSLFFLFLISRVRCQELNILILKLFLKLLKLMVLFLVDEFLDLINNSVS